MCEEKRAPEKQPNELREPLNPIDVWEKNGWRERRGQGEERASVEDGVLRAVVLG